ncbi:MAG: hypothetical protein H0U74_15540 [Bradymonadaceae bacterium]|nr:hypothetical protein [Lujinxingiaceae bacterium]
MELLPGFDPASLQWELTWWTVLGWTGKVLGVAVIPSVLLQRGTRPMAALAWILCLLTIPFLGVFLWWGLGRNYVERRKRRRSRSQARISKSFMSMARSIEVPEGRWADSNHRAGSQNASRAQTMVLHDEHGIFPPTQANGITVYTEAHVAYDAFEKAIREAKHHIHFQFYIWKRDTTGRRFRDLLVEKAREGVEVRVLYDAIGSSAIDGDFIDKIRRAGGKACSFLPVRLLERRLQVNFRNHRKIIVIDGEVAFTGGINIADDYTDWMDMAYRLDGPITFQLQEVFAEDWFFATKEDLADPRYFRALVEASAPEPAPEPPPEQASEIVSVDTGAQAPLTCRDINARVVASGPDDPLSTIHKMFFLAITSAKERLYIITPYFVPDHAIITALQTAAMRGVDVRILVPAKSDVPITQHAGRSYFESLLEVGVRVFEYTKCVLHAKLLVFDRNFTFVGSANMDIRSFRFNFETNVVLDSLEVNRAMSQLFLDTLKQSQEIHLAEFQKRSKRERLLEGGARLLSPLL